MLDFFVNNWGTLLAGVIVLAVVILVIVKLIRDKKKGKKSCGCDCGHCTVSAGCHHETARHQEPNQKFHTIDCFFGKNS